MTFWIIFWKIVFIVTVTLFAVMAVWVTISGIGDIRRLFVRIDERHRTHSTESET